MIGIFFCLWRQRALLFWVVIIFLLLLIKKNFFNSQTKLNEKVEIKLSVEEGGDAPITEPIKDVTIKKETEEVDDSKEKTKRC